MGQISPLNPTQFPDTYILGQSLLGYVDVYLCRYLQSTVPVTGTLASWYMDGQTPVTPKGFQDELMMPLNKNGYKVYAHRRVKVGQSTVPSSATYPANNDFDLCKTFSFDVTRYVCKDRRIRFNGPNQQSEDNMLITLSLVAVYHPAIGDLQQIPAGSAQVNYFTHYQISAVSYGEYETA